MERTLVLVKPDGVQKAVIGAVISRFEDAGFRIIALKMLRPTRKLAEEHYPLEKEWYENLWNNTKKSMDAKGIAVKETPLEMGTRVRKLLITMLTSGPIVAMVVEGDNAIASVRKIIGATSPDRADRSTIRGMYSKDSYEKADAEGRSVRNIVHASDGETAKKEIGVWFTEQELHDYKRIPRND
jgi:nucleoside-diphosphate kinase